MESTNTLIQYYNGKLHVVQYTDNEMRDVFGDDAVAQIRAGNVLETANGWFCDAILAANARFMRHVREGA